MIANTVQSFSGKEKTEEYFEKIEQRAELDNWDIPTTLKIIKYRLTGEAYKFYKCEKTVLDAADISYNDFKKRFIEKFSPSHIPGEGLIKLGKIFRRHDESNCSICYKIKSARQ